jgi:NhaP-type Na+/H+ or K+/H+ antiporter
MFAALGTTISALMCGTSLYVISQYRDWAGFHPTLLELMAFGALIAATDTVSVLSVLQAKRVDPQLFYLVFGESALNDAVALVLFQTFANMLNAQAHAALSLSHSIQIFLLHFTIEAIGSPILGVVLAFLSALIFKHIDLRDHFVLEMSLYLLTMYLPYTLAETIHLSGIVTIFFTGISARRYIAPNVSDTTRAHSQVLFQVAAYLAEVCIFLELGLSVYGLNVKFNWEFIAWALLACLVGRAMSIYPLAGLYNLYIRAMELHGSHDFADNSSPSDLLSPSSPLPHAETTRRARITEIIKSTSSCSSGSNIRKMRLPIKRKDEKITLSMAHILWFSGLRGAVAYACVRGFPNLYNHADEFIATTMVRIPALSCYALLCKHSCHTMEEILLTGHLFSYKPTHLLSYALFIAMMVQFIVLFTIIVMGGGLEYLLEYLGIDMNIDEDEYMEIWHRDYELTGYFHDFGMFLCAFQGVLYLYQCMYLALVMYVYLIFVCVVCISF